jgi:DNA-binding MarR family transcriptional regulator
MIEATAWIRVLAYIQKSEKTHQMAISRDLDLTYSHISKMIPILEERGVLKTALMGRKRVIELTPEGTRLAKNCLPVVQFTQQNV